MKTSLIKIYYLLLAAVVFCSVVQTVYAGSQHVSAGRDLAKLEKHQSTLLSQKQKLEQQVALAGSLTSINQFALAQQYQPIVASIPVTMTSTMIVSR